MLYEQSTVLVEVAQVSSLVIDDGFLGFSTYTRTQSPGVPPSVLIEPSAVYTVLKPGEFSVSSAI